MSRRGGSSSLEFDLNLAPIIDCFTVLITFMLASASFLSIAIFDAGFITSESVGDTNPPPITVELHIKNIKSYEVIVKGKRNSTDKVDSPAGAGQAIMDIKSQFPMLDSVTITAEDSVTYEAVVKTMEKLRPIMPSLVLGGF